MDLNDILNPTIIFEPAATSPDRRRHRHRHRRVHPVLLSGDWDTDSSDGYSSSSDGCSSSDGGPLGVYCYRQPRRHRHRHIHLPAGLPNRVSNAFVRGPTATTTAAAPQNYGYRRLHYQGGREHRGRQRTRPVHCVATAIRPGCGVRSPQRNILVRCGRWLFGESRRYYCRRGECGGSICAPASRHCGDERSRSQSPTRHREEEYWGPGSQQWVYGPSTGNANWRDTPWSPGGNSGPDRYNLAPGGVVEEVEEGGTLPAAVTVAGRTHNHYHIGSNGRSRRSRARSGVRDYMRDKGMLSLVNRERDRELDRNMVDRQIADRQRDREFQRSLLDRETMNQRDSRLLTLLDRERDRNRGGRDIMELLDNELERRRDLRPGTSDDRDQMRLKEKGESDDESEGLRAEMEALRSEFKKLMQSSSTGRGAVGSQNSRRGDSLVSSLVSRSLERRDSSADIQHFHGRTTDAGDGEILDKEDTAVESVSSSEKAFAASGTQAGQAFPVQAPIDEASDCS